ncbi:hypothetical protein [Curtobacterium sp. MCBD17_032]|uniref:hypothetical protein n=1 Tax=Curtobacterium sp. MCBD17_032 TaxID=2175659 RepID=UPI000DAA59C9|nr:hypothetical protein [Curtobacterium sp. MCBD17_032]PZE87059.1 hypothetical protein DEI91_01845 [Curtobacterium sp. MCBD17_032]
MKNLSGARRWVLALAALAALCLVVGLVVVGVVASTADGWCQVGPTESDGGQTWQGCTEDDSGVWWGGALAALGLLLAGLTCASGAVVWAIESRLPQVGPAEEPVSGSADQQPASASSGH